VLLTSLRVRRESQRRMASSGMLRRVALLRTDVSEELSASFIRVTRIGELGTTLAVTSNRRTLQRSCRWGTLPSFLPSAAENPRDPSARPPTSVTQDWHTECSLLRAPCARLELARISGSRSESSPHTYNGAESDGAERQRAAAQPSSICRPEVRPGLFIFTHVVFRPENPTSAHTPLPQVAPSRA
jgi:hypothetical protein